MAASPLARKRVPALLLTAGPVAAVVLLWVGQAYVIPRYLSYLLVPLLVLLASGMAAIFGRVRKRKATLRALLCLLVLVALAFNFANVAPNLVRLPKEAMRDAADAVNTEGGDDHARVHAPEPPRGLRVLPPPTRPPARASNRAAASAGAPSRSPTSCSRSRCGPVDIPCLRARA